VWRVDPLFPLFLLIASLLLGMALAMESQAGNLATAMK
jgi:hypothetical protein